MDDQNTKVTKEEQKKTEEVEKTEESVEEPVVEAEVEEEAAESETEQPAKTEKVGFNDFRVGDTIRIFYKIIEGDKLRTQPYEGIVISKRGEGDSKSFTVRRIGADGVGIERIFPASSPNIDSIKITKRGKVRRAKLYYLRGKVGRAAMRIKEIKK